jgi:pimeloyl-ACP methyl ester carboxylesterase
METRLGRIPAECERPEPLKFAWPLVLLPELFTTARHLAVARGYFASIGWEVYTPDLRAAAQAARIGARASNLSAGGFDRLAAILAETLAALGRDAIVVGHGMGGLLALNAIEHPQVRAAVALAPMLPGFRSPLVTGAANWPARWFGRALKPPRGAVLFHLLADAEPFQREALVRALVADDARAALEVVRGRVEIAEGGRAVPRLIVAGDSDPFAPLDRTSAFAARLGAAIRVVRGRGHWLIGGRALERAVAEVQRFLVRNLGGDLLLLYPEEWKEPNGGQ